MAKQQDDEFEEFEEEEEEEEVEEEQPILPKLAKKKPEVKFQQQIKKAVVEEVEEEGDEDAEEHFRNAVKQQKQKPEVLQDEEPKVQYVPVPRAVPVETLLNELYDQNQTIINLLQHIEQQLLQDKR